MDKERKLEISRRMPTAMRQPILAVLDVIGKELEEARREINVLRAELEALREKRSKSRPKEE